MNSFMQMNPFLSQVSAYSLCPNDPIHHFYPSTIQLTLSAAVKHGCYLEHSQKLGKGIHRSMCHKFSVILIDMMDT